MVNKDLKKMEGKIEASNDVILYPAWWLAPGGKVYDVTEKDFTHAEWIINNLDIVENSHKGALEKLQNIFVEEDDQLIYEYMYSLGWARMRRYEANGIYLLINVPNIKMLREAQNVIDSRKIEFDRLGIAYQETTQVDVTKQLYEEEGFDLVKVQQKYKSGVYGKKTEAMAEPRDIDAYKTWYHGCSDDSKAERIMREGLKPAGITFDSRYKGDLESVKGMVYLTDSSDKAITYSFDPFNNSKYAWLFAMDGDKLQDIYPDEDVIGGILYEELKDRGERSNWLIDLAEENISEEDLIQFRHTHPNEVERMGAKFGKILLPLLTDEQMYELIDKGFAIAHKGAIMPDRVWKADKMKIMNYKDKNNVPLGTNLYFKYAKQVEMVEAKLDKYKIGLVAEEKKYGCLKIGRAHV
jgi:hypothetical protein